MADVLVVGAGPVGLTLAGELARHGVRCRIVERMTQPLPYCRAIGITPRTLEVWEDMGVVRDIIDAGLWLVGSRSVVDGRLSDAEEVFPELPYGQDFFVAIPLPAPGPEGLATAGTDHGIQSEARGPSWTRSRRSPIGLCLTAA